MRCQRFRFFYLLLLIPGAAHADSNITVSLQHVQRAADAASGPEGFVAKTVDLQRLLLFLSFFLFPARLFAMENFPPALGGIASAVGLSCHGEDDRVHRHGQLEVALRNKEPRR